MMNLLIEKYVKKMTIYDVKSFLIQNDIKLDDNNITFFYELIKTNWQDILKYPDDYLKIIQTKVNNDDYQKIYNLYLNYKNYL